MGKHIDLTGTVFGQLTVVGYLGGSLWSCKCSCGDGCTHIEITIDRSPYKSIKLDHIVTVYEAMAVAAVELKLTEAIKDENN